MWEKELLKKGSCQPCQASNGPSYPHYSGKRNNKNAISVPSSTPFQISLVSSSSSTFLPLCHEICHLRIITLLCFSLSEIPFFQYTNTNSKITSTPEHKIISRSGWTIIASWFSFCIAIHFIPLVFSLFPCNYPRPFLARCNREGINSQAGSSPKIR